MAKPATKPQEGAPEDNSRRDFLQTILLTGGAVAAPSLFSSPAEARADSRLGAFLTDFVHSDGTDFNFQDELVGAPFVVNFMFTHCGQKCPSTSFNMRKLQQKLAERHEQFPDLGYDKVKLVSISNDPERDRPDVMKSYSQRFKANGSVPITDANGNEKNVTPPKNQWIFLTRSDEGLEKIQKNKKGPHAIDHQPQQAVRAYPNAKSDSLDQALQGHSSEFLLFNGKGELHNGRSISAYSQDTFQKGVNIAFAHSADPKQDPALQDTDIEASITTIINRIDALLRGKQTSSGMGR